MRKEDTTRAGMIKRKAVQMPKKYITYGSCLLGTTTSSSCVEQHLQPITGPSPRRVAPGSPPSFAIAVRGVGTSPLGEIDGGDEVGGRAGTPHLLPDEIVFHRRGTVVFAVLPLVADTGLNDGDDRSIKRLGRDGRELGSRCIFLELGAGGMVERGKRQV